MPYHYLTPQEAAHLLAVTKNLKHKTCFLLMLDCGLRVSEALSLRYHHFDFKQGLLTVHSLKKRKPHKRLLPLSSRLYECLAHYVQQQTPKSTQAYLFPGHQPHTHLSRKALNRACERIKHNHPQLQHLHPHALRHTFATWHLANGRQLADIKNMLGHENLNTTAIYTHTPLQVIQQSIAAVTTPKPPLWRRLTNYLHPKPRPTIHINTQSHDFTIGRREILQQVADMLHKNGSVLLLGDRGIGKSHLIQQLKEQDRKTLLLDDCYEIKHTLLQCLLYLYQNDKQQVMALAYSDYDLKKLHQHLQRHSIPHLIREIVKITHKDEYLLVIDNVDRITPRGIRALEELHKHFPILTSAREIPLAKQALIWNFEVVRLPPLPRQQSLQLIQRLSNGMEIEDPTLYRNHLYEQSQGNPQIIRDLVQRYQREAFVSADIVREIQHAGSRKEHDLSFLVVILLGSIAMLRYMAYEVGNDSLRFIGGVALILLIISRYLLRFAKRKKI